MKRLTSKNPLTEFESMNLSVTNLYARLKEYEDTGLEPEEAEACKVALMGKTLAEIKEIEKLSIERMKELAKAESEGRLLILPCKVGDSVYYLTGKPTLANGYHFDRVESSRALGFYWDENGLQICLYMVRGNHGTYGYFGKTIFLTREEAEKALRGGTAE